MNVCHDYYRGALMRCVDLFDVGCECGVETNVDGSWSLYAGEPLYRICEGERRINAAGRWRGQSLTVPALLKGSWCHTG